MATQTPSTNTNPTNQKSTQGYGYGKRPLWQWVALYVVLGIIVYGLIYWFFFRSTGTTTSTAPLGY